MTQDAVSSKTYVGLFIAIAGPLFARYGIQIDDAQLLLIAEGSLALIGFILSAWGRQTASGPITHVIKIPLPQALIPVVAPKTEEPKS